MPCIECNRLVAESRRKERAYLDALGTLTATYNMGDEYVRRRAAVMQAELDLALVQTQIMQHQNKHEVPHRSQTLRETDSRHYEATEPIAPNSERPARNLD